MRTRRALVLVGLLAGCGGASSEAAPPAIGSSEARACDGALPEPLPVEGGHQMLIRGTTGNPLLLVDARAFELEPCGAWVERPLTHPRAWPGAPYKLMARTRRPNGRVVDMYVHKKDLFFAELNGDRFEPLGTAKSEFMSPYGFFATDAAVVHRRGGRFEVLARGTRDEIEVPVTGGVGAGVVTDDTLVWLNDYDGAETLGAYTIIVNTGTTQPLTALPGKIAGSRITLRDGRIFFGDAHAPPFILDVVNDRREDLPRFPLDDYSGPTELLQLRDGTLMAAIAGSAMFWRPGMKEWEALTFSVERSDYRLFERDDGTLLWVTAEGVVLLDREKRTARSRSPLGKGPLVRISDGRAIVVTTDGFVSVENDGFTFGPKAFTFQGVAAVGPDGLVTVLTSNHWFLYDHAKGAITKRGSLPSEFGSPLGIGVDEKNVPLAVVTRRGAETAYLIPAGPSKWTSFATGSLKKSKRATVVSPFAGAYLVAGEDAVDWVADAGVEKVTERGAGAVVLADRRVLLAFDDETLAIFDPHTKKLETFEPTSPKGPLTWTGVPLVVRDGDDVVIFGTRVWRVDMKSKSASLARPVDGKVTQAIAMAPGQLLIAVSKDEKKLDEIRRYDPRPALN